MAQATSRNVRTNVSARIAYAVAGSAAMPVARATGTSLAAGWTFFCLVCLESGVCLEWRANDLRAGCAFAHAVCAWSACMRGWPLRTLYF